jgi:hypothetical protein
MTLRRVLLAGALAIPGGTCGGPQSAYAPHGPGAGAILDFFWLFLAVSVVVFVLVVLGLGLALRPRRAAARPPLDRDRRFERSAARTVAVFVAATALTLVG